MKIINMLTRFVLLLIIVGVFGNKTFAQKKELSTPEKQARFIYNFFKYIEWSNYDELTSFNVGVIGDNKDLVYNELIKIAKTEKAKNLPLQITKLKNLSNLDGIQLLYFDRSASLKFEKIYSKIDGKKILLVSEGYPYGKSMINFIMDNDVVRYEINEGKCEAAGLTVSHVLTVVAIKSEKEWNSIINRFENLANSDEKTVEISTQDLAKLVTEQKRLLNEIGTNTKKIEAQKEKLKNQLAKLSSKEKQIAATKKEIEIQKNLITEQLQKITTQQENLASLNSNVSIKQQEIAQQHAILEKEKNNLIAIQEEYRAIEGALKLKEILVKKQGKTIDAQGNEIITKSDKIEKQKTTIWLSVIFLIIVSILGIMAFRSYRLKNKANILILKQKEEIEEQHEVLAEQHREITDSINYAKRIQDAILPPLKVVRGYMPDSFILYQPKDIVAGDFYWMEGINNLIIFAAADCTGHGVPGAMVSVVCHNAMNRAVREFMLVEPHEILDKTREIVLETFEKGTEEVNDGMDIALCTLNTESNKLSFAGANNGLYLIRSGELSQIKADKQPIGKFADSKPFTLHEFDLEKGDVIYTFSDGFPDQFGGPKGKKFMYKPFRELLLRIHQKPMDEQQKLLQKAFDDWKGNMDQIDDVCVIGVRI